MRGLANEHKRRAIFEKHRKNADILVLQETHSSEKDETIWQSEWGGKAIFNHGSTAARGIAVFMTKSIFENTEQIVKDEEGRTIIFNITEDGQTITIAAIYAPNNDSPKYFTTLDILLKERSEHKIILGDFNLALDVEQDRENTYCNNNKAKDEVENIMDHFSLKDIWRIQNGDKREFSWMKKGQYPIKASRIDLALVSAGLDQKVAISEYISSIYTDHRALYLVFDLIPFQRGTGYWKLNTSLLQNQHFVQEINTEIDQTIRSLSGKCPTKTWETIKKRIKTRSIELSRNNVTENNMIISQLSEKVNEYESRLPLNKEENSILENTKAELEDKTMEKIKGIMFRSKAKWYGRRRKEY